MREKAQSTDLSQGAHQHGFSQPGHAFQQGIAARQQGDQGLADQLFLPDDHLPDLASMAATVDRNCSGDIFSISIPMLQ